MTQVTILYFAAIRTSLPSEPDSDTLTLPPTTSPFTLLDLRQYLTSVVHAGNEQFAMVLAKSGWSVDEEMVETEGEGKVVLKGGETVCPIPPVSGG